MNKFICPICESGNLEAKMELNDAEYGGVTQKLPLHFSECDSCGSETATAEQTRNNKRAMIAFKKHVDGLLSGVEVRALRKRFNISQVDAAKMFGGGPVAFSKYESDDVMQADSMDKLLRLALEVSGAIEKLARDAGVALNKKDDWQPLAGVQIKPSRLRLRVVGGSSVKTTNEWRNAS